MRGAWSRCPDNGTSSLWQFCGNSICFWRKTDSEEGDEFTKSVFTKKAYSGGVCSGQAVTEYAVVLAAVSLAGVVLLSLLGSRVQGVFSSAVPGELPSGGVYTVSYDAGGGSGGPEAQSAPRGETLVLSEDVPVLDGYEFSGWASEKDAEEPEYLPGDSITGDGDLVLYALWQRRVVPRSSDETSIFTAPAFIDGPRRISAAAVLRSGGNGVLAWDFDLSLASTVFAGDSGYFSGTLSIAGKSIPVGEENVSAGIVSKRIPVSNMSGTCEIEGLTDNTGDVPWTLAGQLRLCNSGTMYGVSAYDQTVEISLSGVLAAE